MGRLSAPERRRQLIEVAGQLFATHGYHGLSMERLAEAAGVSKPVLYQHFPSKRDLYLALVDEAVTAFETAMREALDGTTDNRARVEGAIAAYLGFVGDRRFTLLFTTAELGDTAVRDAVEAAVQRVAASIATLIAADAGVDHDDAMLLATALCGLSEGGARWWLDHDGGDPEGAAKLLARLAWRGLGGFGAPPTEAREADSIEAPPPA